MVKDRKTTQEVFDNLCKLYKLNGKLVKPSEITYYMNRSYASIRHHLIKLENEGLVENYDGWFKPTCDVCFNEDCKKSSTSVIKTFFRKTIEIMEIKEPNIISSSLIDYHKGLSLHLALNSKLLSVYKSSEIFEADYILHYTKYDSYFIVEIILHVLAEGIRHVRKTYHPLSFSSININDSNVDSFMSKVREKITNKDNLADLYIYSLDNNFNLINKRLLNLREVLISYAYKEIKNEFDFLNELQRIYHFGQVN